MAKVRLLIMKIYSIYRIVFLQVNFMPGLSVLFLSCRPVHISSSCCHMNSSTNLPSLGVARLSTAAEIPAASYLRKEQEKEKEEKK